MIEKGARLDAVNNDGELAIDLAEGNKMEVLITNAMEKQGIHLSSTCLHEHTCIALRLPAVARRTCDENI